MTRKLIASFFILFFVFISADSASRYRRQTYYYPEELRKYARPHAGTRFYQGSVGRYAPREWPSWYQRTLFKWNGESRLGPYHPNDVRFLSYQQSRVQ